MISQKEIKKDGLSRDDIIKIIMETTGNDLTTAEFIYALEVGEIQGDTITVDKNGNEIEGSETLNPIRV